MRRMTTGFTAMLLLTMLALFAAAPATAADRPVRLAYVDWSSSVASANLIKAVLQEHLGRDCRLMEMTADRMWQAVAKGEADAMLSAWLPDTHAEYYARYKDQMDDLGPNLEGTRIGLVVPNVTVGRQTMGSGLRNKPYMTVDSIPELKKYRDKLRGRIIGIDPAAGIMTRARQALEAYGLDNFRLVEGSEVSMTAELSNAIRKQRWIVVTGWVPHWMFGRWNLKFLKDPKGIFGGKGHISTMARRGLKQDMPRVHQILDRFNWTPREMEQLLVWIKDDDGMFPYEKAQRWLRYNKSKARSWLP